MNKNVVAVIGVVVVVVASVGGYMLVHNSSPSKPAGTTTSSSNKAAVNNAVLTTKTDSKLGQYLANPAGMALYIYGGDASGVSNCTGSCLANWPAYQATGSTTNLPSGVSTIKRTDNGQTQYTYNGMPLYTFVSDSAGKVTGDGVENFSVAKPAAAASSSSTTTPSSTPTDSSSSNPYNYGN